MSNEFGELLKKFRDAANLSQTELLDELRQREYPISNKGTVSKWESGKNLPQTEALIEELEDILHIPPGMLLKAAGRLEVAEYRRQSSSNSNDDVSTTESPLDRIYALPLVIKAREEHMMEIRAFVEKLTNIQTPYPADVTPDDFLFFDESAANNVYEISPLFNCLKQHIPDKGFWERYYSWRNNFYSYMAAMDELGTILMMEEGEAKKWPDVVAITDEFTMPILKMLFHIGGFKFTKRRDSTDGESTGVKSKTVEVLLVNDIPVLTTNAGAENTVVCYTDMAKRIITGEQYKAIVAYYQNCRSQKTEVDKLLEPVLLSRSYLLHTCELCPGGNASIE